jgi:glycosyltransferase involved in cell wall biosynthesis
MSAYAKITVVTPSFNQGRFIGETIKSIISQEGDFTLEYIIMDGGSTDETVEVIKKYERLLEKGEYQVKCRGVKLIWRSEKDKGQAHAVNKGFKLATGEVLGWVNSDDTYMPGAVSTALEYFEKNKDVSMVYGQGYHITEAGQIIERYPTEPYSRERLFETCFICQPAVFLRRTVLDEAGLLDDKLHYCMDYEYWLRISQKMRVGFLDAYLANTRLYVGTKTMSSKKEVISEITGVLKKMNGRVPYPWVYGYAYENLDGRLGLKNTGKAFRFLWALFFIYKTIELNGEFPRSEVKSWFCGKGPTVKI